MITGSQTDSAQSMALSITAPPAFTAPFATVPATLTAVEPTEMPTPTAVPATDTAVEATETATQPVHNIKTATQALPRTIFIERIGAESGSYPPEAGKHGQ